MQGRTLRVIRPSPSVRIFRLLSLLAPLLCVVDWRYSRIYFSIRYNRDKTSSWRHWMNDRYVNSLTHWQNNRYYSKTLLHYRCHRSHHISSLHRNNRKNDDSRLLRWYRSCFSLSRVYSYNRNLRYHYYGRYRRSWWMSSWCFWLYDWCCYNTHHIFSYHGVMTLFLVYILLSWDVDCWCNTIDFGDRHRRDTHYNLWDCSKTIYYWIRRHDWNRRPWMICWYCVNGR